MGTVVTMRCVQCGYERKLYLGGGLRDCKLETLFNALPPLAREELKDALGENPVLSIKRQAAFCPDCREWFALPVVKCVSTTKTKFLYGVCPDCAGAGERRLPEETEKTCPKCGAMLSMSESGLWD